MTVDLLPGEARTAWWRTGKALARVLTDLLTAEGKRLRPAIRLPPSGRPWIDDAHLGEGGLGFDSLDRLSLAASVSELLCTQASGVHDELPVLPTFGEWRAAAAHALDDFSSSLTFRTSGSTGKPKSCLHALADLEREIDAQLSILGGSATRILSAVPAHHIYGFLFTVLLPQRLPDAQVLDIRASSPGAVPNLARAGDLIIGYPDFWAAVVRAAPFGWPKAVTGVTSTAPCPPEIAEELKRGGLARLVEVHGSSETAGLGWRDDPRAPYQLLPMWQRLDADLVVRVARAAGSEAAEAVSPPDSLGWVDDRHYRVTGRRDGAVQVGGVNVFPARVRDVLREHPDVAAAAVRLMNEFEGRRLKAFIVPKSPAIDHPALRDALDEFAAARLSSPEQPRAYTFGDRLPGDLMGKAADWPLPSG